jgi:SAF domain
MTTTTPQASSMRSGQPPPRPAPQLRVGPPPRERRPALAVAAVVLILVSAAIAATVVVRAGDRSEVLAVARTVPVGQQLTASDLKRVRISTDPGLHAIPVSAAPQVVGKVAATTLLPGTLLTPEQLGASQLPGPGQAIVGLDLKGAQMPVPAERLQPGAKVRVVATPSPSGAPAAEGASLGTPGPGRVLVDQAEVFSVQAVAARDAVHVAVVVAQPDVARVLRAAAVGQVGLAVLPAGTAGP